MEKGRKPTCKGEVAGYIINNCTVMINVVVFFHILYMNSYCSYSYVKPVHSEAPPVPTPLFDAP